MPTKKVKPVPEGYGTLTPTLTIKGCAKAIEFYKRALGAEQTVFMPTSDGKAVLHAEMKLGNSVFFLSDEIPGMTNSAPSPERPSPANLWAYVNDCDAAYKKALAAGAKVKGEPTDMFWGDRCAAVVDPFGYGWTFATHVKDVSDDEMRRAGEEFAKKFSAGA
jgi:PhnB protein